MVYLFFAEGFEEVEAIATVDVLRRAACDVQMVGIEAWQVSGAHGIEIKMDTVLSEIGTPSKEDVYILPGGQPGTNHLGESQALKALLQKAAETGCLLAAICAAPSVLDRWGLINGKRMTCYPTYASKIKHGIVVDAAVVTVPGLITGRGVGVALAFGLAIVAALKGSAESEALRKAMVMPE